MKAEGWVVLLCGLAVTGLVGWCFYRINAVVCNTSLFGCNEWRGKRLVLVVRDYLTKFHAVLGIEYVAVGCASIIHQDAVSPSKFLKGCVVNRDWEAFVIHADRNRWLGHAWEEHWNTKSAGVVFQREIKCLLVAHRREGYYSINVQNWSFAEVFSFRGDINKAIWSKNRSSYHPNCQPSTLVESERSLSLLNTVASSISSFRNFRGLFHDLIVGDVRPVSINGGSYESASSSSEHKPSADRHPNLLPMCTTIAALLISPYCFWYLQFGANYDRWWGLITLALAVCFVVIVYSGYAVAELF